MRVSDYVCIRKSNSIDFAETVRQWLKKGYELYGPPVMQVSPTLVSSRRGPYAVSANDTYDFMQVLVKPVKAKKPLMLPVVQGVQNCADCSCDPAGVENRACGRISA